MLGGLWPGMARGQVIRQIEIRGIQGIEEDTIRSFIHSAVGQELSREQVSKDIQAIFASGFVTDVRVESEAVEGGVRLIYQISEKPLIQEVKFEGNTQIKKDDLQGYVSPLKAHAIYDAAKVQEAKARIEEEYTKKGFFLTEVTPEAKEVEPGQVELIFHIRESKKPLVKKVELFGNQKLSDRELHRAMQGTKPTGVFTRKSYSREEMFRSLYFLDYYYKDHGFLDLRLTEPERLLSPDLRHVFLGIGLEEGVQYRVGAIQVTGDLLDPEAKLKKNFALQEGQIFRQSQLQADVQFLTDRYGEEGYALVDINYKLDRHPETQLVDVTYDIHKGKKVYFERIEFSGNQKTHDQVVRRELTISETQLYSSAELRHSQARVQRLGFFESVEFVPKPGSAEDRVNVDVVVKERPAGAFTAGAGYSTTEDVFFNAQYQQANFLGRGQSLAVQTQLSSRTQNYFFRFDDPYFLDSPWRLGVDLFSTELRYLDFTQARRGGSVTVGRAIPHTEHLRASLTYALVQSNLESFAATNTIYRRQPANLLIGSLTSGLEWNGLDNYLDPTKGARIFGTVQTAGYNLFGGSRDFVKTILDAQYYQPIPKSHGTYLSGRMLLGFLNYSHEDELLITERFFLGGIHTLRGYDYGAVGPQFREDFGTKTPIGGNKELVFSLDYVIPLSKSMGLKLVTFYDAGNAYNDYEAVDLSKLRQDWGFGLRWVSPMGPLRFELGFPIQRRQDERSEVFNFAIGSNF
jgi:outer membrane protein insertion porin family